jgi:hypothetical protein
MDNVSVGQDGIKFTENAINVHKILNGMVIYVNQVSTQIHGA